jgi:hypothetical protein
MDKIKKILKENKVLSVIICSVFILSFIILYFLNIRPSQIRKQCSETTKYDFYQYANTEYNEVAERQKQEKLGEYIQCRNNNLIGGDKILDMGYITSIPPYPFTPAHYISMPLDEFNQLVLGKLSPYLFKVYVYNNNAYVIDNSTYDTLKENKDKYPQCSFPDDFAQKELSGGSGEYKANASDTEYKNCLRNNGLNN